MSESPSVASLVWRKSRGKFPNAHGGYNIILGRNPPNPAGFHSRVHGESRKDSFSGKKEYPRRGMFLSWRNLVPYPRYTRVARILDGRPHFHASWSHSSKPLARGVPSTNQLAVLVAPGDPGTLAFRTRDIMNSERANYGGARRVNGAEWSSPPTLLNYLSDGNYKVVTWIFYT